MCLKGNVPCQVLHLLHLTTNHPTYLLPTSNV